MKSFSRPYTAITLSMIFWSLSFVWFKVANKYYDPITIIFLRLCIAIGLLSLFLWLTHGFKKIQREDRKYFLMLAISEPFLYFLGESFGLTLVSSTVGSVIISTIPLFAILLAWIFLKERLSLINYIGAFISFLGLIVFLTDSNGTISINPKGLLLMFLAVFSAVGYNMVLHRLSPKYNAVLIVLMQSSIGAVFFLPLFLIFDLKGFMDKGIITEGFTAIVLLSVFASCAAFVLYAYSVKYLGISLANVFCNLIPVFTAIFAFFIIAEVPTLQNIIGMVIAVTGLFLSQKRAPKMIEEDAIDLSGKSA